MANAGGSRKIAPGEEPGPGAGALADAVPAAPLPLLSALCMGVTFGAMLQKSRVYEPAIIRAQFVFDDWTMLITFLSAASASALVFAAAAASPVATVREALSAARAAFDDCCEGRSLLAGVVGGGVLLGAGMAVAGACPGMVLAQIGTGVPNSGLTFAGGLLGALAFGLLEPTRFGAVMRRRVGEQQQQQQQQSTSREIVQAPPEKLMALNEEAAGDDEKKKAEKKKKEWKLHLGALSLDRMLGLRFSRCALALGICCLAVAAALEATNGHAAICGADGADAWWQCVSWRASAAGVVIGLLQAPCIMLFHDSLGSASAYQTLASQWLAVAPVRMAGKYRHMAAAQRPNLPNLWQAAYVAGAMAGAALSKHAGGAVSLARSSGTVPGGPSAAPALIGGFLMLLGSRCAGGCTSGHGLSGMGMLAVCSMVAVPAMFAGGIVTAYAWRAISSDGFAAFEAHSFTQGL